MRVLQVIDVLWGAITLFVRVLNFALKREEFDGMEAATHGLEVIKEVDGLDHGLVKLARLEFAEVRIINNVQDKLTCSSFCCLEDRVVAALRLMGGLFHGL